MRSPSSAAGTVPPSHVSRARNDGSAATLDHPAPPVGGTSAEHGPAGGVVDPLSHLAPSACTTAASEATAGEVGPFSASTAPAGNDRLPILGGLAEPSAVDIARSIRVGPPENGGSAALLDHPAPPQLAASTVPPSAGGVVEGSRSAPPSLPTPARQGSAGGATLSASTDHPGHGGPTSYVGLVDPIDRLRALARSAHSDHPAPPPLGTSAMGMTAGGVVGPSAVDTALSSHDSLRRSGGSAAILDHLAPSALRTSAGQQTAGGVVGPSLSPARPPFQRTSSPGGTAAGGREFLTLEDVMEVYNGADWEMLRSVSRIFTETQKARKRVYQLAGQKADGSEWMGTQRPDFMGRELILESVDTAEKLATEALGEQWRLAATNKRTSPLRQFATKTPGIRWFGVARILGEAGHPCIAFPQHWEESDGPKKRVLVDDPPYLRGLRQWYSRCGMGDPARRLKEGMTQAELMAMGSPSAKVATWLVVTTGFRSATGKADKTGKMRRAWPYRVVWDDACAHYDITHPEWKPYQRKRAADRVMAKAFLRDLYMMGWADIYWRLGRPMPQPFPLPLPVQ